METHILIYSAVFMLVVFYMRLLVVMYCVRFIEQAFPYIGPHVWNQLREQLWSVANTATF